jgi:hypothetical protein
MNISKKILFLSILCTLGLSFELPAKPSLKHAKILSSLQKTSLSQWIAQCKGLAPKQPAAAQCSAQNVLDLLSSYSGQKSVQFSSSAKQLWVDQEISNTKKFEPFTQKLIIPAGSTVYMWGDLHGDVQTLVKALEKLQQDGVIDNHFAITQPQIYFLFLGDYTDRGHHGTEVLYTLLRLLLKNPERVFCVRGNHEDADLNARLGFYGELTRKFAKQASTLLETIERFYNTLPVALFVGTYNTNGTCNYLQCCHGGMELGYHPHKLFALPPTIAFEHIVQLPRLNNFKNLKNHMQLSQAQLFVNNRIPQEYVQNIEKGDIAPFEIGFMWNDFSAVGNTELSWYNAGRGCGLSYGQNLVETLLRWYNHQSMHKVRGVIRAHQHNASMPGIFHADNHGLYKLPWQAPVFTTVATQQFTPGCFLQVQTAPAFEQWHMTRIHCNPAGTWESLSDTLEKYA